MPWGRLHPGASVGRPRGRAGLRPRSARCRRRGRHRKSRTRCTVLSSPSSVSIFVLYFARGEDRDALLSPFFTTRPSDFQWLKPATSVASGPCRKIIRWLLTIAAELRYHIQHSLPESAQVQANVCEVPRSNAFTDGRHGSYGVPTHAQRDSRGLVRNLCVASDLRIPQVGGLDLSSTKST
jgi:hypothetical protein